MLHMYLEYLTHRELVDRVNPDTAAKTLSALRVHETECRFKAQMGTPPEATAEAGYAVEIDDADVRILTLTIQGLNFAAPPTTNAKLPIRDCG